MDVVAKLKCVMQLTVTSISVPLVLQCGKTPLHVAAENNHVDVVTKLLYCGADPNIKARVSTVYPRKWCSVTLFIEILFLLGMEFFGGRSLCYLYKLHLYQRVLLQCLNWIMKSISRIGVLGFFLNRLMFFECVFPNVRLCEIVITPIFVSLKTIVPEGLDDELFVFRN